MSEPEFIKTENGHLLYTRETCPDRVKDPEEHPKRELDCHVCDDGFGICSLCGMAEGELVQECPGRKPPVAGPTGDHLIDTLGNMPRLFGMGRYDTGVIATAIEEIEELRKTRDELLHALIDFYSLHAESEWRVPDEKYGVVTRAASAIEKASKS